MRDPHHASLIVGYPYSKEPNKHRQKGELKQGILVFPFDPKP